MSVRPLSPRRLSEWYTDFFTELANAFWRAVVPPELTTAEVDFILRTAAPRPSARILDVPCGSGRHALELARRGYRVTGIDISAEAIDHARAAAAAERMDVDFRVGDMRALSSLASSECLPGGLAVDTALCLGNSFGYLEHRDNQRFLAELGRLVVPGGTLVIDYGAVAEALLPSLSEELPMTAGGVQATAVSEFDPKTGRLVIAFTFRRGDEIHEATCVQHIYSAAELTRMVETAGFGDVELYADVAGTPFDLGSARLLLVARRPG